MGGQVIEEMQVNISAKANQATNVISGLGNMMGGMGMNMQNSMNRANAASANMVNQTRQNYERGNAAIQRSSDTTNRAMQTNTAAATKNMMGSFDALKAAAGAALTAMGAGVLMYVNGAVKQAIYAEKEWVRVYSLAKLDPSKWDTEGTAMKKYAREKSNLWGIETGDLRNAMSVSLAKYQDFGRTKQELESAALLAQGTGTSVASAENSIMTAMMGRLMTLKKVLTAEELSYVQTGAKQGEKINAERLHEVLLKKYGAALEARGNTEYAQMIRNENAWSRITVTIGNSFLPLMEQVSGTLGKVMDIFNTMPDGVKTGVASLLGLVAALSLISGPIITLQALGIGEISQLGIKTRLMDAYSGAIGRNTIAMEENVLVSKASMVSPTNGSILTRGYGGAPLTVPGQSAKAAAPAGGIMGMTAAMSMLTVALLGITVALTAIYFWQGEVDKKRQKAEAQVTSSKNAVQTLKDLEKEQAKTPVGSERYKELQNEIANARDEAGKLQQATNELYNERAWSIGYQPGVRSYAGSDIVRSVTPNMWSFGMGTDNWGYTSKKGMWSSITGEDELKKSAGQWASNPADEQKIASVYELVFKKQDELKTKLDNGSISQATYNSQMEGFNKQAGEIVGPENVQSLRNLYDAEKNLQKSRQEMDKSMADLQLSIINVILSIFGFGASTDSAASSATNADGSQKTMAQKIQDTATKAQETANNINDLITKIQEWIKWLQDTKKAIQDFWNDPLGLNKGNNTTSNQTNNSTIPVSSGGIFTGGANTNPGTIPGSTMTQSDFNTKMNQKGGGIIPTLNSPLTLKQFDRASAINGMAEIRLPDLDPDKFRETAIRTGKELGSGGLYIDKIVVYANTKSDARVISDALGTRLQKIAEKV